MHGKLRLLTVCSLVLFLVLITGCIDERGMGKGTLKLSSTPGGAEVYLDDQYKGTTPSTIADVAVGNHTIEFRRAGYQSWSMGIVVSPGTYEFTAQMTPLPAAMTTVQEVAIVSTPSATLLPEVTIHANRETMIIGDTITFTGTSTSDTVILVLYGPGYYASGITLDTQRINPAGTWTYTWNPGQKLQSGSYTMIAYDSTKVIQARVPFTVIGGGEVTITTNNYAIGVGDQATFSGRCTTGSKNVILTLSGPGQYANGVIVSTPSVMADKTWTYTWKSDSSTVRGSYTMSVQDADKTQSSFVQFSVGA